MLVSGTKPVGRVEDLEGRRVSAITVQKLLNDKGLGTRHELRHIFRENDGGLFCLLRRGAAFTLQEL